MASRLWSRWRGAVRHQAIEHGLAPIATGVPAAGGVVLLRASALFGVGAAFQSERKEES